MEFKNLTGERQVCWDWELVERAENISLETMKSVRKNVAIAGENPWEKDGFYYGSLIKTEEGYRLYYRNGGWNEDTKDLDKVICVAESRDGKTFTRTSVGLIPFNGSKENNIVFTRDRMLDNFSVFLDPSPNCPEDERYKALSEIDTPKMPTETPDNMTDYERELGYYKSKDGFYFSFERKIPLKDGCFDSMNLIIWDEKEQVYRIYYRTIRDNRLPEEREIAQDREVRVRGVMMVESKDFIHWSDPVELDYGEHPYAFQLYTNGVTKYERADIYYGISTRYIDLAKYPNNFNYLPSFVLHDPRDKNYGKNRKECVELGDREATAITDCILMTSRDGKHFLRTNEAFLTPGPENGENWNYGDCYLVDGMAVTASDYPGEPDELSIYVGKGSRYSKGRFERYTLRMDGLRAWAAGYTEDAMLLTKPFTLIGADSLQINFETSVLGFIRIMICDEEGQLIEGYDSNNLFGDSVERPVDFEKKLSELGSRTVRLKIQVCDAKLYSFLFVGI